ncbi:MAG: ACT domain-containing protein [Spirochaetaceae bacterium]|nr:ACT domain-containing protein [Spirochaetaceae bacterium]
MKKQIVISVLSKDRPGIIADVAGVIYELNGDLADMSQSVLNGFFSMSVIAQFDENTSVTHIIEKIEAIDSETALEVIVKETGFDSINHKKEHPSDIYVVTGQGKNRTGLVAAIASFCRSNNIKIIDYDTKLSNDIYSMILEIDLSKADSAEDIHNKLDVMAEDLGLKIVMQHKNLFETVNEISLD